MSFDIITLGLAKSYTDHHGGGGGQVQPDWNQNDNTKPDYVKNRPFYAGDPVEIVLLEETTATFAYNGSTYQARISVDFSLEIGTTYEVSWDGIVYSCVGYDYIKHATIGNQYIFTSTSDTGEPFIAAADPDKGTLMIATRDTSAFHTISISKVVFDGKVVKIDEKYLPEGYPTKSVQTTTLMEEQEVAFALNDAAGKYVASLPSPPEVVEGQTYAVNWDGTEYECVCVAVAVGPESLLALGNLSIMGVGDDTGEPFLYSPIESSFITLDTSASHTISVKRIKEIVTPMAYEFLPAGVGTTAVITCVLSTNTYSSNLSYDELHEILLDHRQVVFWEPEENRCSYLTRWEKNEEGSISLAFGGAHYSVSLHTDGTFRPIST